MVELSGLEVLVLIREIDSALQGSYVNNIFSLGDAQVLRFRKAGGQDVWLVASPSKGMWVSETVSERGETTEFTTELRRVLERAKFAGAKQLGLDRIFEVSLVDGSEHRLILELMPPGNLLVVGADGRVVAALNEVRTPKRRVYRGSEYTTPDQTRTLPTELTEAMLVGFLSEEKTVGKALGKHVALPRKYVAEVLARLSLRDDSPASDLSGKEGLAVEAIKDLLTDAAASPSPSIGETPSGEEIFAITPSEIVVKETSQTVSALCDKYLLPEVIKGAQSEVSPGDAKEKELQSTIANLRARATALAKKGESLRGSAGRALQAPDLEAARKVLAEAGVGTRKEMKASSSVASILYDAAKEAEANALDASKAAERLAKKIPRTKAKPKESTKQLSRRKFDWFEKFRWFRTSQGKLAIGGRDAQTNSAIIRRHMEDSDTVYHADLFGSPFFVLKGGADQTIAEVGEVAQATVAFSSAWKTGLGAADAYWVRPDQVSTAASSGEFLARGSFSIRGKKNFVEKNLVELAVGLDPSGKLVSGPESSIGGQAAHYLVLRPHKEKGSDTAKKVLKDLEGAANEMQVRITVDDVMRSLPSGGGKVVRSVSRPKA